MFDPSSTYDEIHKVVMHLLTTDAAIVHILESKGIMGKGEWDKAFAMVTHMIDQGVEEDKEKQDE